MGWIAQTFLGSWVVYAVVFAVGVGVGAVPAWEYQSAKREAVQAKFDGFVAQTKAQGEAAEAARLKDIADRNEISKRKEQDHEKRIQTLDAKYAAALTAARRVLPANTLGRETQPLSSAATVISCPDRQADIAGGLADLEVGVLGLLKRGETAIERTALCKEWIDEQVAKNPH